MEFESKNSFEPDKSESTDPELKLLNDGRSDPESGASVVAGIDDEDEDEDEEDGDSAFRNESGIIDPLSLPLPLLPLLLPLLPLLLPLLPLLLPLLPNIIYFIILYYLII